MNIYKILKERHQKEWNEFPMFFAFSNKQFDEGIKRFGLDTKDTDKLYRFGGTGGFYLKTDAPILHEMIDRHDKEFKEAIKADVTGEGFIFDMFNYELANHEYVITYSVSDTLDALGLTREEVNNNPALTKGLELARKAQFDN